MHAQQTTQAHIGRWQRHRRGALLAVKNLGIVYQERSLNAAEMAIHLVARLGDRMSVWSLPSLDKDELSQRLEHTDLLLVLGGDGTILSVARDSAVFGVPLLAVNFGRVGFLTELEPHEVEKQLPLYLEGDCWVDERAM